MTAYLNCGYWSRMWIVQEFWLARSVVILGPNLCASDKDFLKINNDWVHNLQATLVAQPPANVGSERVTLEVIDASRRSALAKPFLTQINCRGPSKSLGLAPLILRHRKCICTDPRDRIFAILGLLDGEQALAIRRYLPNYSLSYDEVFIIALAVMIEYRLAENMKLDDLLKTLPQGKELDGLIKVAGCLQEMYPGKDHISNIALRYGLSKELQELRAIPFTEFEGWGKVNELCRFILKTYSPDAEPTETVKARIENARQESLSPRSKPAEHWTRSPWLTTS
jgi:hypothetical protein